MRSFLGLTFLFFTVIYDAHPQTWASYYDSTEIYWHKDWQKCIDLLEKAISSAEQEMGKDNNNYAVLLNDLGLSYWHTNNFEQASRLLQESLEIKKSVLVKNSPEYAVSLLNAAGIYQEMGDVSKAENLYKKALAIYPENHPNFSVVLNHLGLLKEAEGNYHEADKYFRRSIEAGEQTEINDHTHYAASLNNLAGLYRKMGRYEDAEALYLKASHVYEANFGQNLAYGKVISNLGALYQTMGRYSEAEKSMLEAVDIVKRYTTWNFSEYANLLNNLGSLYKSMGNYKTAQRYFDEFQQLHKQHLGIEDPAYAASLNNLGGLEMAKGNLDKAEALYLKAAHVYKSNYGEEHPMYSATLNNLASLYRKKNAYQKAESYYLSALEIDKERLGKHHPLYATTLGNLGLLYIAMGQNEKAEEMLEQAIAIKSAILSPSHPSLSNALNNLAILHYINKDFEQAEPLFLQAIESQLNQIETLFPSMSEREKGAFYATLKWDLERFNTFAVLRSSKNPAILGEMYNNQLAIKGLIFRATDKMRNNILSSGDEQLIRDFNAWKDLKDELAQYYRMPRELLKSKQVNLDAFEEQLNDLEKKLSRKSSLFAGENQAQEVTWRDVQSHLEDDEAAIEIIRFRDFKVVKNFNGNNSAELSPNLLYGWSDKVYYAALVIRKEDSLPKLVLFENGQDMETRFFAYYRNTIKFNMKDELSYVNFWQPIKEKLNDVQKVYISPDGIYFKVNLNAIVNPRTGDYIMDEMTIRQVTTTKEVIQGKTEENQEKSMVLIGDPAFHGDSVGGIIPTLPGTGQEVENIALLSSEKGWESKLLTGEAASEEMVKALTSPKVLHIATHGYFSDNAMLATNQYRDNPLFNTGLLLAGAGNTIQGQNNSGGEDGLLTAYEAMNLKLDATDLVILSACETGLGEVRNGEGVYGLQRAFKVAGVGSLIFSLWKVDDKATQKLFTYFYENWLETGNRWEAFKYAREKLRLEYPSPYYWGAFVMVGE